MAYRFWSSFGSCVELLNFSMTAIIIPITLITIIKPMPPQKAILQIHGNHQLPLSPPIQNRNKSNPTKLQPTKVSPIEPPIIVASVEV